MDISNRHFDAVEPIDKDVVNEFARQIKAVRAVAALSRMRGEPAAVGPARKPRRRKLTKAEKKAAKRGRRL